MLRRRLVLGALLAGLALATLAFAGSPEDLLEEARILDSDYHALAGRFGADTEPHDTLASDFEALETRRGALESERPAQPSPEFEDLLAHAGADAATLRGVMGGWEEQ